ncbi:hypothetical protein LOTGIDRAFT_157788 [Lottia gigantea]|uniref:Checkpoint protein RAD24-like helical bundle domain-containing protein n=1 Tax=Lottia gigantea TaxID=225164 RepID=V4CEV8_LOTGI|nr:hypothetical protein LOTGIDRAFT_157788 [Lottia gigantea]ESP00515.1 hypothetical protein LOTGIDRAFT_157788 [Lottia gigantea]
MADSDDDIEIIKVDKPKKTPMKWVTSTFDDFSSDFMSSQPKSQKSFTSSQNKSKTQSSSQNVSNTQPSLSQPANSRKRPRETKNSLKQIASGRQRSKFKSTMELWADIHQPKTKADLAVHKKKIEEVENWIIQSISNNKMGKMLLMTGPAGAGKTATVKVLSEELNLELQEWSNPDQNSNQQFTLSSQDYWEQSRVDIITSGSQQSQFENFLLRANKYQSLQIEEGSGGGKTISHTAGKLILLEFSVIMPHVIPLFCFQEFPNIYLRDNVLFHQLLRRYYKVGHSPLIFIVSDSSRGESKERQLFPPDLQQELYIHNISFNPVAPTMMVKVLNKIVSQQSSQVSGSPSLSIIESISMSSAGDIRSGINALQFACRTDTFDLNSTISQSKPKKSGKTSASRLKYESSKKQDGGKRTEEELGGIGARDTSCFLFHAIGKILYSKRDDPSTYTELPRLPPHLQHEERDPLLLQPEDVVEKSQISGDYFASFLHHNYVDFYTNIDDVVNASEYFSLIDTFSSQWNTKTVLENYATSLASRGVIHCNTSIARYNSPRTGVGWKPLHKSQWFNVQKQSKKNASVACSLFKGYHWEPEVLWTEILPYLNRINITLRNPAQINFLQEMGRFCRRETYIRNEKLNEHEVVDMDDSEMTSLPVSINTDQSGSDMISNSQSEVKNTPVEDDEEEVEIEEFNDSD